MARTRERWNPSTHTEGRIQQSRSSAPLRSRSPDGSGRSGKAEMKPEQLKEEYIGRVRSPPPIRYDKSSMDEISKGPKRGDDLDPNEDLDDDDDEDELDAVEYVPGMKQEGAVDLTKSPTTPSEDEPVPAPDDEVDPEY